MRKLLNANFSLLKKSKWFWYLVIFSAGYCVAQYLYDLWYVLNSPQYTTSIEEYYFSFGVWIGLLAAMFAATFIGNETAGGLVKNKIVVGHKRSDIYMANWLAVFFVSVIMAAAWCLTALVFIPWLGGFTMPAQEITVYLCASVLILAVYASLYVFIGMLTASKSGAIKLCIIIFLALMIVAARLVDVYSQPEITQDYEPTANGMVLGQPVPNPDYIGGTARNILEWIIIILPTTQGFMLGAREAFNLPAMMCASAIITVFFTLLGLRLFNRKDLK